MATEYWSCFFSIKENELPKIAITDDNCSELADLMKGFDEVLQGLSRKNWILYVIEDICKVYNIESLKFLTKPWAIISPIDSEIIIADIDSLFQSFIVEPKIISDITGYPELDVLEAMKEAKPSLDPHDGLDNDSIYYLMPLLLSVRKFLQDSIREYLYVVFLQPQVLHD